MSEQSVTITFKQGNYECVVIVADNKNEGKGSVRWKFSNTPENYKEFLLSHLVSFFLDKLKEAEK